MAELESNIIKCKGTGNIVEIIHAVDCADAESLNILDEKTSGEGEVKHVPVITRLSDRYNVKVGEVEHPMDDDHYIALIEIIADGQIHRQQLKPGDKPEVEFIIPEAKEVTAREYCTKHGLWKA